MNKTPMAYEEYRRTRYFAPLDGLRAVAVILVLADHSDGHIFALLHGFLGVTAFFVLSGFLITTILLRESEGAVRICLRGFYTRRVFRILPLYLLALLVFSVLVLGLHMGEGRQGYSHRLIYFLTFTNEFAGTGTFDHSWSMGVEEKYYIIWPVLAFVIFRTARLRTAATSALLFGALVCSAIFNHAYFSVYGPILAGCLVAQLMHDRRGFAVARRLATGTVTAALVAVAVAVSFVDVGKPYDHDWFGLAVALLLPAMTLGSWLAGALDLQALVYIGRRSYAMYLFSPLCGEIVDKALTPTEASPALQFIRFLLLFAASVGVAEVLHRLVERPAIHLGRRLTSRGSTADCRVINAPVPEAVV